MAADILTADTERGPIFACIAASRFTEPGVADTRLGAVLRPYPDADAATAALVAAGGANVREFVK